MTGQRTASPARRTREPSRAEPNESDDEDRELVVHAADVRKAFGDTVALDDVTMGVEAGEVFALVGPNGAGKTTFVRCLTGTLQPDAGRVELFGEPNARVDPNRIGVLPQSFTPQGRLTPRELVSYHAGLYERPRDPEAVLADVGLDPASETFYEDLSGGEQRRLGVATTLVNDPDLVFLDEPTTGVDPAGRHRLWDRFESIAADGTTIVLTTHDMAEAERLADRVGLLADGRLVRSGRPRELVHRHAGEARLVVETDDGVGDPTRFDSVAGYDVEQRDDGLGVTGIGPDDIGDVVDALESAGVTFDALSWREPTLEDAYFALVDGAETSGDAEGAVTDQRSRRGENR